MTIRTTILALVLAPAFMAPAMAETPTKVVVSYADLNLASAHGRDVLERRVALAAGHICGPQVAGSVRDMQNREKCLRSVSDGASPQIAAAIDHNGVRLASR